MVFQMGSAALFFTFSCLLQVVPILTKLIQSLSAIRLYIPNDLRSSEHRLSVLKSLQVSLYAAAHSPSSLFVLDTSTDLTYKLQDMVDKNLKLMWFWRIKYWLHFFFFFF